MPLPQRVVDQLSNEPPKTPGWSLGMLTFSGGLLLIVIIIYAGLTFGYEPYLNGQVSQTQTQIDQLSQQISPADQANLINFYSQISNLQTLLGNHIIITNLFSWLEANTEPNVYYNSFEFSGGNQITISAVAENESDVNQQVAIFQASPEVQSVVVSSVTRAQTSGWAFGVNLTINPSMLLPTATTTSS